MSEYCSMCDELVNENPGGLLVNPEHFAEQLEQEHNDNHPVWKMMERYVWQ